MLLFDFLLENVNQLMILNKRRFYITWPGVKIFKRKTHPHSLLKIIETISNIFNWFIKDWKFYQIKSFLLKEKCCVTLVNLL